MLTALITGANRGIGLALTQRLLARGDTVFATARAPDAAEELQTLAKERPTQLHVIALDVGDEGSVATALAQVAKATDHVDLLVNNAGVNRPVGGDVARAKGNRLGMLSAEALLDVYRVNAVGAVLVTQAAVDLLKKGRSPRILNISSMMGSIAETESGGDYAYRMSKAAMNMATRVLAADLRPAGIAVRSVHPGWVKTRMGGSAAPVELADSAEGLERVVDRTAMAETGTFVNYDGKRWAW